MVATWVTKFCAETSCLKTLTAFFGKRPTLPASSHGTGPAPSNDDFSRLPDAFASLEPDGMYFRDNGGNNWVAGAVFTHLEQAITREGEPFDPHEFCQAPGARRRLHQT
jgi:hypothetical protein